MFKPPCIQCHCALTSLTDSLKSEGFPFVSMTAANTHGGISSQQQNAITSCTAGKKQAKSLGQEKQTAANAD